MLLDEITRFNIMPLGRLPLHPQYHTLVNHSSTLVQVLEIHRHYILTISDGKMQLIKLNLPHDAKGSHVEVLERYVNLGPIVDFCVADLQRQGKCHIVTCSGAYKDGSLRVVGDGTGINELASVELQGIKGMWSLRSSTDDPFDTFLVEFYK
ncbi:DNA damage-binding protein 1 [Spatholobus suberectus]|nr:DNA damage-binding protein 1 [Spatholobus suberectus]